MQTLGVGLDALAVVGNLLSQILQLGNHRAQTCADLLTSRIVSADVRNGALARGELLQNTHLIGIKDVAQRR